MTVFTGFTRKTLLPLCLITAQAWAADPSYDCKQVKTGSIEDKICQDAGLSALDVKLAEVYKEALRKAVNEKPPALKAEQRGWIKGRNDCWKSDDRISCIKEEYIRRIAELQVRYRLLPGNGPVFFECDNDPRNELAVTFFRTEPATLTAERGDSTSLMYQQISASGARYQGRNESFWEHQGVATVIWGNSAKEMICKPRH